MDYNKDHLDSVETRIIHIGYDPELSVNSAVLPTYDTTTYVFPNPLVAQRSFAAAMAGQEPENLIYCRLNHPDAQRLEDCLVANEPKATAAKVFNSGMAAISTVIFAAKELGLKKICYTSPVYGGTYAFFEKMKTDFSVNHFFNEVELVNLASDGKLGVVYIETPSNPTMIEYNIAGLARAAKAIDPDCLIVVDNTFLGFFQAPFLLSEQVDVIVYSATKFLGGHSDVLAGVVLVRAKELDKKINEWRMLLGNILSPHSSSMLSRSLSTYRLRMSKQQANAQIIVSVLRQQPWVEKVFYPGRGSIVSFTIKNADIGKTFVFLQTACADKIISLAVSLGSVETLITHPASTTHSEMPAELLNKLGITDNFIRLSVGMEDPTDIVARLICGASAL